MPRTDTKGDVPADSNARTMLATKAEAARRDATRTRFTPPTAAAFVDETVDDVAQAIDHLSKHANVYVSDTEPTAPYVGMLWLDTS